MVLCVVRSYAQSACRELAKFSMRALCLSVRTPTVQLKRTETCIQCARARAQSGVPSVGTHIVSVTVQHDR